LKSAVDAAVREMSDALDAKPNDVRAGLRRVLEACVELGGTMEDARDAVAPTARAKGTRAS
jgi:hypothetical protein